MFTTPTTGINVSGLDLNLGRRNSAADFYFRGVIDDIGIYKGGLSLQQIDSLYNAPNLVVSANTAVEEQPEVAHIFPNPSSGLLNIQHPTQEFNRLEIISVDGRTQSLEFPISQQQQLDLSDLQAGLYLLRIWREGELLAVQKFSKL